MDLHSSPMELHYDSFIGPCYKHYTCIFSPLKSLSPQSLPNTVTQANGCLNCSQDLLRSSFPVQIPLKPNSVWIFWYVGPYSISESGVCCLWNSRRLSRLCIFVSMIGDTKWSHLLLSYCPCPNYPLLSIILLCFLYSASV